MFVSFTLSINRTKSTTLLKYESISLELIVLYSVLYLSLSSSTTWSSSTNLNPGFNTPNVTTSPGYSKLSALLNSVLAIMVLSSKFIHILIMKLFLKQFIQKDLIHLIKNV